MKLVVMSFLGFFCVSSFAMTEVSQLELLSMKYDFRTVIGNQLDMEVAHMDYDSQDDRKLLVYFQSSKGKACYKVGLDEILVDGQSALILTDVKRSIYCDR